MRRVVVLGCWALVLLVCQEAQADERLDLLRVWERAIAAKDAGQVKEAVALYEQTLRFALRVHGETHADTAVILSNLAFLYMEQGKDAAAERLFQRNLAIREKVHGRDHPEVANTLRNLGFLYRRQGKYAEAEPLLQRSLAIREKVHGKDHPDVASALNYLADLYIEQGKYVTAEPLYQRSLAICEKAHGKDHPDIAPALNDLANLHIIQAKYDAAEPLLKRRLAICEKAHGKDHSDVAFALNDLAGLYKNQSKYVTAEPLYQRSLAILEKAHGKDHPDIAITLRDLATLYMDQGMGDAAEPLLKRSLAIYEKVHGKDHYDIEFALADLARLYIGQGKYAAAEPLLKRSLAISEKAHEKDHPAVAFALNDLASLYIDQGKYAAAEPLYQRSLAILEKAHTTDHPDVAATLRNLANLYVWQYKDDAAEPLYERSLAILEKVHGKDHPAIAITLRDLATLYELQGKYAAAERLYQRSLAIDEKVHGKDNPALDRVLLNLVFLYARQSKYAEAQQFETRLRQGTRAFLLRQLPALTPREQLDFLGGWETRRFAGALSLAYRQPHDTALRDASAGWLLNGKAIALEARTLQARLQRDANDAAGRALLGELASLRRREAGLALQASKPDQAEAIARQRADLEARRGDLEKRLASRGGATTTLANLWIELDDVRKALPAEAVLLDIARFEPQRFVTKPGEKLSDDARYVAWVVPPAGRGDVRMIDLGEAQAIDAAVAAARKALEDAPQALQTQGEIAAEKAAREPLAKLAKLVLEPLRKDLDPARRWVISPDGALWLAPWAALPLDETTYAVEKHTIQLVLSGRDLLSSQPVPGTTSVPAVFADPDFDGPAGTPTGQTRGLPEALKLGRIPRLPGTAVEGEAVAEKLAKVFGAAPAIYTERRATSAAFLALNRPRALTLATHGYFLPDQELDPRDKERLARNPDARPATRIEDPLLRCGLLLAGCNKPGDAGRPGILTGHEVLSADLRGCELVILSACETGLGDIRQGEGVAGLRQAFQLAGAESVLASLWKVPDAETTLQMVAFMDALAGGKDRVEALAQAQRTRIAQRREKFGAAHPFNWAAFSLTGGAGR